MMELKKIRIMRIVITLLLLIGSFGAMAQKYKSSESYIRFFSDAPMEDIEAENEDATSIVDWDSKALVFVVPISSFQFEKKLMQEHFNENYLETDKYPKAFFKGKIVEWDEGQGSAKASGELEIHGVKQNVEMNGELKRTDKEMEISAVFNVRLEDYKIKIPKAVFYNIAEEVEVTVKFNYGLYEKN